MHTGFSMPCVVSEGQYSWSRHSICPVKKRQGPCLRYCLGIYSLDQDGMCILSGVIRPAIKHQGYHNIAWWSVSFVRITDLIPIGRCRHNVNWTNQFQLRHRTPEFTSRCCGERRVGKLGTLKHKSMHNVGRALASSCSQHHSLLVLVCHGTSFPTFWPVPLLLIIFLKHHLWVSGRCIGVESKAYISSKIYSGQLSQNLCWHFNALLHHCHFLKTLEENSRSSSQMDEEK